MICDSVRAGSAPVWNNRALLGGEPWDLGFHFLAGSQVSCEALGVGFGHSVGLNSPCPCAVGALQPQPAGTDRQHWDCSAFGQIQQLLRSFSCPGRAQELQETLCFGQTGIAGILLPAAPEGRGLTHGMTAPRTGYSRLRVCLNYHPLPAGASLTGPDGSGSLTVPFAAWF